jgi:hypothetical protein
VDQARAIQSISDMALKFIWIGANYIDHGQHAGEATA